MARNPITQPLPQDLPENWDDSQYVSPNGTEVGLTEQHGYNYLMQQVNSTQKAVTEIGEAFENLASLDPETGKIAENEIPKLNYQTKTEELKATAALGMSDTFPFYSEQGSDNKRITLQNLKNALGVQSPSLEVIVNDGAEITVTDGTTTLTGTGTTLFSIPNIGVWNITVSLSGTTLHDSVNIEGALRYTRDCRMLTSIAITHAPTKTAYINGDTFDPAGLVVRATFVGGTTADVTDQCTYSPTAMVDEVTQVVFTVTIASVTKTATQSVTVDRIQLSAVPSQSGSLTYLGSAQTPNWNNYDSSKMTMGGDTSKTNAGTYTATFTPGSRYKWPDGTKTSKSVNWSIDRASGSLSINKTTMSLNPTTPTDTIEVTRAGDGTISVVSSDSTIASVSVSGTKITVTGKKTGNVTITVSVAQGTNHNAPENKTCAVSCSFVSETLNSNTWQTIKEISDDGQGANYWAVGDTKTITINGTVAGTTFSNLSINTYIIGFNHNSSREGNNRIHFQIGKINRVSVALCPNNYGSTGSGFCMNTTSTNSGGWNNSNMRKSVLGNTGNPSSPPTNSLLAALPSDLRAVMKSVTKYSDNTGGGSDTASHVTSTTDYLFLLAEFEVHGARTYANSAEKNYQAQYAYFSAGNSKVKYKHNSTGKTLYWWSRSVRSSDGTNFCDVYTNGGATGSNAYNSSGVAPGFCV